MSGRQIVDTFPAFLEFWLGSHGESTDAQVEVWASVHMAHWPELLAKQQANDVEQGEDRRRVARETPSRRGGGAPESACPAQAHPGNGT